MKSNLLFALIFAIMIIGMASGYEEHQIDIPLNIIEQSNNATGCNITFIEYANKSLSVLNTAMTKSGSTFYTLFSGDYFNQNGDICFGIRCTDGVSLQTGDQCFTVTPNGEEITTGKAVFYMGLFGVLIFFFAISLYFFTNTSNLLAKVGSFGFAYIMLTWILFVGWNMSSDFLTSAPIISDVLRVLFFVFMIGTLPLLLGSLAWYVIMLFRLKEITNMMEKGIPYDEAQRRTGKKFK